MVNRAVYDYHVLARLNHKILVGRNLENLLQSCMTDEYAIDLFKELCIPKQWIRI